MSANARAITLISKAFFCQVIFEAFISAQGISKENVTLYIEFLEGDEKKY